MRIAAFADLHCGYGDFRALERAKSIAIGNRVDVAVIAGDVTECSVEDVFKALIGFNRPLVYCMGNHEFAGKSVDRKISEIETLQKKYDGSDIFCLDVLGTVVLNEVMFAGGCLWYDGTLGNLSEETRKTMMTTIDPDWYDCRIKEFNPLEEHKKCIAKMEPLKHHRGTKVMLTHTCPHQKLNWFEFAMPDSKFNIYSGCKDILSEFKPDIAICGHTHKQIITNIEGTRCFNIGNDYYFKTKEVVYSIIETNLPNGEPVTKK